MHTFKQRVFVIATLVCATVLVTIVAVPQWLSKQARLEVLRSHVAQVAQLAASVVDGDLHRQLLTAENYGVDLYQRALQPLVKFHSASPDIFYVYTMVERDGEAYFVLDTAASSELRTARQLRASAYMEHFALYEEYASDWLQQIAAGKTWISPDFQHDDYGYFLSGHAPIYDPQGRYSGFVGVDFDIQYYLAQERRFRSIGIGSLIAALLASLLIGYVIALYYGRLRHRMEEHYYTSVRDELTGLLNRRGALEAVNQAIARRCSAYAAILVDIDDLKLINDSRGHAAGDAVLARLADAIRKSVRDSDIVARLGGDEFMIFAPDCDVDVAEEIARRVLARVGSEGDALGVASFGVSVGICVESHSGAGFDNMYRRADEALYRAKSAGKNRFEFFGPQAVAVLVSD